MFEMVIKLTEDRYLDEAYYDLYKLIMKNKLMCGSIVKCIDSILPSIVISDIPYDKIWEFEDMVKRELIGYDVLIIEVIGE